MATVGFEPTPFQTSALNWRLRPLGQVTTYFSSPPKSFQTDYSLGLAYYAVTPLEHRIISYDQKTRATMKSVSALEQEIAQMENRLTSVKVSVEVERQQWQKANKKGKHGTKWRGARSSIDPQTTPPSTSSCSRATDSVDSNNSARTSTSRRSSRTTAEDQDEIWMELSDQDSPYDWDPLELAQCLRIQELYELAVVVTKRQISGRALLECYSSKKSSMKKLQALFATSPTGPDASVDQNNSVASLPLTSTDKTKWRRLLRVCYLLLQHHKMLNSNGRLFPRLDGTSQTHQTAPKPPNKPSDNNSIPPCKIKPPVIKSVAVASKNLLSVCRNCGNHFARDRDNNFSAAPSVKQKAGFCSEQCRQASAKNNFLSVGPDHNVLATSPRPAVPSFIANPTSQRQVIQKTTSRQERSPADGSTQLWPSPPSSDTSPPTQRQGLNSFDPQACLQATSLLCGNALPVVRSRINVTLPTIGVRPRLRRAPQLASYAPTTQLSCSELCVSNGLCNGFDGNHNNNNASDGVTENLFTKCFLYSESGPLSSMTTVVVSRSTSTLGELHPETLRNKDNFLTLQRFLPFRAFYRLSLVNHAFYRMIHQSFFADTLWKYHFVQRFGQQQFIRHFNPSNDANTSSTSSLGESSPSASSLGSSASSTVIKRGSAKKKFRQFCKQLAQIIRDNLKILLNAQNWQFATIVGHSTPMENSFLSRLTSSNASESLEECFLPSSPTFVTNSQKNLFERDLKFLFEEMTLLCDASNGVIVGILARELIQSMQTDVTIVDICQRLRTQQLVKIQVRRIRLFSESNRLDLGEWIQLGQLQQHPNATSAKWIVSFGFEYVPSMSLSVDLSFQRQVVWKQIQKKWQTRLLEKARILELVKELQEKKAPPQVFHLLEEFLLVVQRK